MAKDKSRNYSIQTIKRLYGLSDNKCSFPDCDVQLFTKDTVNLAHICHIEDAHKNLAASDRYNPNMTDEQRAGYNNLILLCPNHHKITDNTDIYTVTVLKEMKEQHIQKSINKNALIKSPSALNEVINYIGENFFGNNEFSETQIAPNTENKIRYNDIHRYKHIIKEYSLYQGKLNRIYEEIEVNGSIKKNTLLKNIRQFYLLEKRNFVNFNNVKENADNIIDNIKDKLWEYIEKSKNYDIILPIEVIEMVY
jgi:hypothetical protein